MTNEQCLHLAAIGMVTAVGGCSKTTACAIEAGISAYQEVPRVDGKFDGLTMALVPEDVLPPLDPTLQNTLGITTRQARMLRLGAPAIEQALKGYDHPIPLFLSGPEPLPNFALPMRSHFLEHLKQQSGANIDLPLSKVFPMGRASIFYALEHAWQLLQGGTHEYVLVGGIDSYWDSLTLSVMANNNRIQTTAGQPNAFVPGEAACMLLVSRTPTNGSRKLHRPGLAEEPGCTYSDTPTLGDGLTNAFRAALGYCDAHSIEHLYSSLNGESSNVKDLQVAITRNSGSIASEFAHHHPAEFIGDTGGASGAIQLALAAISTPQPSLCFGASDHEFRGAACVS